MVDASHHKHHNNYYYIEENDLATRIVNLYAAQRGGEREGGRINLQTTKVVIVY